MGEKQYSVMEYLYRDSGNNKERGEILLEGEFSEKDITHIRTFMYSGEFFVPENVRISPLQPKLWEKYNGPTDDLDHEWHEIECFRNAKEDDLDLPLWGTKEGLIESFQKNWEQIPHY
jgi:hypothetical protein